MTTTTTTVAPTTTTTVAPTTTTTVAPTTTTTVFPTTVACDKLIFGNIGYAVNTGTGDGSYDGYTSFDAGTQTFIQFDDASAWSGGFVPTSVTYQWQTLSGSTWSKASWDTGTNPLTVTNNTPLLNTISGSLKNETARLFFRATDGTTVQDCAVLLSELE